MSLPEFSIHRPVTVFMACMVAILLGAIAFVQIPVDLMPETEFPTLSVNVTYQGVAPEEMETLVVRPLEQSLAAAPFLEEITSTASEGSGNVRLRYTYGTDLDEAANDLRARIDRRRDTLPDDIDPPTLYKFDISQFPIMFLTVASDTMDPKELRHFTEKSIQYRVERVPGVAQARVSGGLRRQIHVNLSLKKMRALDLSMAQVVQTLREENLNRPVGPVHEGRYEVLLRTQGEFKSVEDILGVGVTNRNGVPVYIRDMATVDDSHEDIRYLVGVNGQPAVRLFIYKQSGANTVEVSEQMHEEIAQIQSDYPGITIDSPWDSAQFIRASINNVQDATLVGAGLAVVVLLFFLRNIPSTLIIGAAIPISVIATFALMYFNGFTLNTVSFGGLALGVGMLVDNSIVVLENIFRHREEGKSAKQSAIIGSREVVMAITASTLTTIAVFVPVLFMGGYSAQTFQQLAWVVSFALFCSLMVSVTIVPLLSSRFLRVGARKDARGLRRWAGDLQDRMADGYANVVAWALDHRLVVTGLAAGLFAGALYLAPLIGVELEPELDEGSIEIEIELEPGTRAEITNQVVQRLERTIRDQVPEVKYTMTEAGSNGGWRAEGTNAGELRIELVDRSQRSRSAGEIAREIRSQLSLEPGMTVQTRVRGGIRRRGGGFGDDRLSVEIRGHDLEISQGLAQQVRGVMQATPGIVSSQMSQKPGMPEMVVSVDRAKATSMGLKVSEVADTLETAIGGTRASMFREDGDEYDILVRLQEEDRLAVSQVGDVPLTLPDGRTIAAESVVRMQRQEGPFEITRSDQQRIMVVNGNIADRDLGSIVEDLSEDLAGIQTPPGYEFKFGGEFEEQQEAFQNLTFAAILALVLVYMVMASQFESMRDPFIILFSIPLAFIGIVLTLLLTKTTFNIQGFLGVIVLVGIVVNNAIVLIDYTNLLRREHGYPLREAVITAGRRRLRPILMTTVTTVLGLTPMALGLGEGGELQAPMARVVIGGLTTSTLITLVFIPMVYMTVEEISERAQTRREAAAEATPDGLEPVPTAGD
jgi:HAE1 family hydrophobic/amphiphilic exporter-1